MKTITRMICIVAVATSAGVGLADDFSKTGTGPVKVFLLIGQSNMNGRGDIKALKDKLIRSDPNRYPPTLMQLRKDVWIFGANGDGISGQKDNKCLEPGFGQWKYYGPELSFGHKMGDLFPQQVLIIKCIGGGTSLGKDWVPPTMSKRTGRPVGHMYKKAILMTVMTLQNLDKIYRDYKPEMGYQLCGVFWCQGNADGGQFAKEYGDNLVDFINDLRTNLGVLDLPFVAAQSLSSRTPGDQFIKGCDAVNAQRKNHQAAAIAAKDKINLKGPEYAPYNTSGDGTHWRHNCKAYIDVGNWAADLMKPMLLPETNHATDAKVQATWNAIVPQMPDPETEAKMKEALEAGAGKAK